MKPSIGAVLAHFYGIQIEKDRTGWQKVLCPLHAESHPSASVNLEKARWGCFVCDVSEDGIDVIRREMSIGFREACEFARGRFGGGGEDVFPAVPRKSGRGVHGGPRAGRSGGQVRGGIRPFGTNRP
ncbi:CHC2 zinc finger domain-containing protein [Kitasatospora sp. NPDC089913]|uniref:CHC2 zinc finger domain-containing protein n=1 Tax=Kitasatospora sp. NPDC089913 TaxID=3364080 RepID=UPI003829028B